MADKRKGISFADLIVKNSFRFDDPDELPTAETAVPAGDEREEWHGELWQLGEAVLRWHADGLYRSRSKTYVLKRICPLFTHEGKPVDGHSVQNILYEREVRPTKKSNK